MDQKPGVDPRMLLAVIGVGFILWLVATGVVTTVFDPFGWT